MASNEYGLFFNSDNGDRIYDADSFSEWLRKFFTSGVFSGDLQVTAASGMTVTLGTGYANLDGKVRFFETAQNFTCAAANSTYPRIDTVVIERNDTDRQIIAKLVTGAYSGNTPSPTAPVWDNGIYQLVVAQVLVGAGVTQITQEDITDTRTDTSICGLITGTVQEMDFAQFTTQFNAWFAEFKQSESDDFDAWFEGIRGQLDEDAAGHLQNEVDALDTRVEALEDAADLGLTTDGTTLTSAQELKASNGLVVTGGRSAIVDENGDAVVGGNYGTTPVYTGMKWSDGKKVYMKALSKSLSADGSFQTIGTLGNFNALVSVYGCVQDVRSSSVGGFYGIPFAPAMSTSGGIGVYVDTSGTVKAALTSTGTFSNCIVNLICYYTRTSD